MSNPTAKDKKERAAHLRRVNQAAQVLQAHGYNTRVEDVGTYDRLIVDRIFAGARMEKVSLEHVRECLKLNGLSLMFVERYSMLMATVDDVRNPTLGFNKAVASEIKRKAGNNGKARKARK